MSPVQNRSFLGAIAAAIVAFCKTFIRSMGVVEDVVAMGEKSVRSAREKQVIDLAIEKSNYANRALANAALTQVKQELATREFIGDDQERKALMDAAKSSLKALIDRDLAELHQKEEE